MKTQILTKKAACATLLALIISGSAFAQTQGNIVESDETTNNVTFALCILLFIVGFAILIALKIRDDKKHLQQTKQSMQQNHPHILHRNHYGHRHQYHH